VFYRDLLCYLSKAADKLQHFFATVFIAQKCMAKLRFFFQFYAYVPAIEEEKNFINSHSMDGFCKPISKGQFGPS